MSPAPPASSPSESLYRQIIDSLKEVVFQADAQGRWTFLTPVWTELTGFTVEQSLGRKAVEFIHTEDRLRAQELFQLVLNRQTDSRHEVRFLPHEGRPLWVELFARPLLGEDGGLQGVCGTLTDVTGRRRTSDALARRERYLSALVEMQHRLLAAQQEGNLYRDVLEPIGRASGASRVYLFEVQRNEHG